MQTHAFASDCITTSPCLFSSSSFYLSSVFLSLSVYLSVSTLKAGEIRGKGQDSNRDRQIKTDR